MKDLLHDREARQRVLKGIIMDLHAGRNPEAVRDQFKQLLDLVGPEEIMALEQSLVDDGLAVEEITKLCDVHVAVFRESLEQAETPLNVDPDDPLAVFTTQTARFKHMVDSLQPVLEAIRNAPAHTDVGPPLDELRRGHERLTALDRHYAQKENVLFPYLERHGVPGPSQVMWAVHDEIRAGLRHVSQLLLHTGNEAGAKTTALITDHVVPLYEQITEMVFKEENILYPTCVDLFSAEQWRAIGQDLLGETDPSVSRPAQPVQQETAEGEQPRFQIGAGAMTAVEITSLLNHLPFDITFVGADDTVKYFSEGKERIFERTRAVIGRSVQNCHPPSSVHVVEEILNDFRSGARNEADFWLQSKSLGGFIYIRYFAVRSPEGEYLGTLEVSQNVTAIRALEGERRILDDVGRS